MISMWKRFAHICMHMYGYLFIFAIYDAVTPCPVFDCKIFLCHITFSFSEDWAFFPVKSSPPVQSVSQSHSFSLSFSGPSSPFLTALCLITSYLKWQLTSWGCNGGWLTEKEQQNTHTHTHNLNPPCTPCSHSLSLSLSHTYIYTHTDLFAPVLMYKRICSSSLLVLRGHQWGYGDTLGGGARTRFTRYCLHTQPAARWKTDGRRHISWVFCCTEDERQQRAAVGH